MRLTNPKTLNSKDKANNGSQEPESKGKRKEERKGLLKAFDWATPS